MEIEAPSAGRLESIVLVKLTYYASSTARFLSKLCSNYARFFENCAPFFQYYARQKMGITVRKVSFIDLLFYYCYYHCSPDFACCFSGF